MREVLALVVSILQSEGQRIGNQAISVGQQWAKGRISLVSY